MKILILISPKNGIGNTILLSPAIKALRLHMSDLEIYTYGSNHIGHMLSGLGVTPIGRLHPKLKFDHVFVLHAAKMLFYQNRELLGHICEESNIHYVPLDKNLKTHEAVTYMAIPYFFGYQGGLLAPYCDAEEVSVPWASEEKAVIISDTANPDAMWKQKRWPHFKTLAGMLYELGYSIVLIGGRGEAELFDESGWAPHYNLMGKLTLPQLAGTIKKAHFFIGNDSGPTHISAAVGAKTFAIYGPTSVTKNHQLGKRIHVLSLGLNCQPCQWTPMWKECRHQKCMNDLTPAKVLNAILNSSMLQ